MATRQPPTPEEQARKKAAENRKLVDAALEKQEIQRNILKNQEKINNAVGIEKDLLEKQNKIKLFLKNFQLSSSKNY